MKRWCAALMLLLLVFPGVRAESAPRALYYAADGVFRCENLPDGDVQADVEIRSSGAVFRLSFAGVIRGGAFDLALFDTVMTLREAFSPGARGALLHAAEKSFALLTAHDIEEKAGESALFSPCAALLSPACVPEKGSKITLTAGGQSYSFVLEDIRTEDAFSPAGRENEGSVRVHTACNLRAEPSAGSPRVGGAGEREEFPLLEQREGWYRVRLNDGREAWLSANMARLLPPPGREDAMRLLHAGEWTGAARVYDGLSMADAAESCRRLIAFKEAETLLRREEYTGARAAFEKLGAFGGADKRAESLNGVEKMPESGVLFAENPALPPVLKVECPLHARPFLLVFTRDGEKAPALKIFIRPGDTLTAPLAAGEYALDYAMGNVWYGEENAFGPNARRARARLSLPENTSLCTLSLSPKEGGNTPFEERSK